MNAQQFPKRFGTAAIVSAIVCALALAGCGGDASGPAVDLPGSYLLVNVNGVPLPVHLAETDRGSEFVDGGVLTLTANGTFSIMELDRVVTTKDTTTTQVTSAGTYTTTGTAIKLRYTTTNTSVSGTFSASTISLGAGGIVFVYQKKPTG